MDNKSNSSGPVAIRQQGIIARAVIDIIRAVHKDFGNRHHLTNTLSPMCVLFCVWLGEDEGRALYTSEIAHRLSMPVSTVADHLKTLTRLRIVREVNKFYVSDPDFFQKDHRVLGIGRSAILNAARELDDLDATPIGVRRRA